MGYTKSVEFVSHLNRRSSLRYAVGAVFCWLLVMYAVGAKLALYHTKQPGARSVAATKAWQEHDASVASVDALIATAAAVATPQLRTFSKFSISAFLLAMVFATVWVLPVEKATPAVVRGFSPALSVRPPPAV